MDLKEFKINVGNISIGDKWEIFNTKIYNDDDIVIEQGKSIRTVYTVSGEKSYTEWVYCTENNYIEKASDLVNKYIKKYFKSNVNKPKIETKETVSEIPEDIPKYLSKLKKIGDTKDNINRYSTDEYIIDHHLKEKAIIISNLNGKVVDKLQDESYSIDKLNKYIKDSNNDPADVNTFLIQKGYTDISKKSDENVEFWVYRNPNKENIILHSGEHNFFTIVDKNNNMIVTLEDDNYSLDNIRKELK